MGKVRENLDGKFNEKAKKNMKKIFQIMEKNKENFPNFFKENGIKI